MCMKWYGIPGRSQVLAAVMLAGVATAASGEVGVGININIGPPPIAVPAPPAVVMVPQSQVYFVPGLSFDVFFYGGYWWSPRGNDWYRSRAYQGPWSIVEHRFVPPPVVRVPHDYRKVYGKERHIPYGQWKKEHEHHKKKEKHGHGKGHDKRHGEGNDKEHGH